MRIKLEKSSKLVALGLATLLAANTVAANVVTFDMPAGGPGGTGGQTGTSVVSGTPYDSDGNYDVSVSHVVINQVYGGDTNGYASHSFIELYNPTDEEVDLSSWSVQYKSSEEGESYTSWSKLDLTGEIEANGYYLVRCAEVADTSNVKYDVPKGQQQWDQTLYNKGLSVVLMSNQTLLDTDDVYNVATGSAVAATTTGAADTATGESITVTVADGYVDMAAVGGNDALDTQAPVAYETAFSNVQSKKKAIRRTEYVDTDNNANDFSTVDYSKSVSADMGPHGYSFDPIKDIVLNIGSTENDVNVTWYATSADNCTLEIAKASDVNDGEFPTDAGSFVSYDSIVSETNYTNYYAHSVSISDLTGGTSYIYHVSGADDAGNTVWSELKTYKCQADSTDGSFGFLVVGDPQIGTGSTDTDTEGWIETMQTATSAFADSSFVVSVGDQIDSYTAGNTLEKQYAGFLDSNALLSSYPFVSALGNHDAGRGDASAYTTHYTLPNVSTYGSTDDTVTGEEDYYYTYNDALFMVLNTNSSSIAEHKTFIENTIAARSDCTWRIVIFHQSIYSVASHVNDGNISELRTGLSPVLTANDIDVVLMGHDHVYARSYIMGGETGMEADVVKDGNGDALTEFNDPDGVQYVTLNSASGSKYYNITQEQFEYTAVQNQEKTQNYSYVKMTDDSFEITTYRTADNTVVDTFKINKTVSSSDTSTSEDTQVSGDNNQSTNDTTQTNTSTAAPNVTVTPSNTPAPTATVTPLNTPASTVGSEDADSVSEDTDNTSEDDVAATDISDMKVKLSKRVYTYDGKNKKPTVTISGLKSGTDYTVSYSNNKAVGTAKVTVKGTGDYTGVITASFTINPKGVSLISVKKTSSRKASVKWSKGSYINGYEISYAVTSSYKNASKVTVKKPTLVKATIKNLKSGKKYYYRIRTYKTVNGKKYYSTWSKNKKVTM